MFSPNPASDRPVKTPPQGMPVAIPPGRATVAITLDAYSHAIPALQEEAAALIAGLVFAGQ